MYLFYVNLLEYIFDSALIFVGNSINEILRSFNKCIFLPAMEPPESFVQYNKLTEPSLNYHLLVVLTESITVSI